jgi:hypothetical protein
MARLRQIAEAAHLGQVLLYAAIATYFVSFFAAIELALLKLPA